MSDYYEHFGVFPKTSLWTNWLNFESKRTEYDSFVTALIMVFVVATGSYFLSIKTQRVTAYSRVPVVEYSNPLPNQIESIS